VAGYEELRRQALGGYRGPGLALLVRHGLKMWIETCSNCAVGAPLRKERPVQNQAAIPAGVRSEVVALLAGMILETCSSQVRS